jgi:hypothetical protein
VTRKKRAARRRRRMLNTDLPSRDDSEVVDWL